MRDFLRLNPYSPNRATQQGMILVSTLIAMLLITLMGVFVVTVSRTELLVVNNSHQAKMSLTDAESMANISCGLLEAAANSLLESDFQRHGPADSWSDVTWGFFQPELLLATVDYYTVRDRYRLLAQVDGSEQYSIPFIVLKNHQTGKIAAKALVFNDYAALTKYFSGRGYGGGHVPGASAGIADGGNTIEAGAKERFFNIVTMGHPSDGQNEDEEQFGLGSVISVIYRSVL